MVACGDVDGEESLRCASTGQDMVQELADCFFVLIPHVTINSPIVGHGRRNHRTARAS